MPRIIEITPHFSVSGALQPDDIGRVAAAGFRSIVSNLPDGELRGYPASAEERSVAERAGLGFRHIPVTKADLFSDRVVAGMREALADLEGPILAHCASGQRSALAWAAAAASIQPVERVLAVLKAAGFNFEPIRDELEDLRAPSDGTDIPPALDAGRDA